MKWTDCSNGSIFSLSSLWLDCICTDNPREVTAKEGSCVKIRNIRGSDVPRDKQLHIVWLKDAVWKKDANDFEGTVVYSQKPDKPPESSYTNRVSMAITPDWTADELTIENLRQEDSGRFSCRYYAYPNKINKWISKDIVSLKVEGKFICNDALLFTLIALSQLSPKEVQWFALLPRKTVVLWFEFEQARSRSSLLHVLPVFQRVYSWYTSFLPHSKTGIY